MNAIKIKITPNVAEHALLRLMRVGDRLWRASDERFGAWGLTDNHYNVLRILNGAGEPLSQSEIGRRMQSTRANVTKLIDALEAKAYLQRLACDDRRVNQIVLTKAGADFLQATLVEVQGFANAAMQALNRAEQKTLLSLLAKLDEP